MIPVLALFGPLVLSALLGMSQGCSHEGTARVRSRETSGGERVGSVLRGEASYYASSLAGRRTASGQRYDPRRMTAAHRKLPFGTKLRVTRVDTGKTVVVTVNDRGPFGRRRRILDLSRAAAEKLGMIRRGVVEVRAEVLE
jgi:rare lipoprotein A